MTTPRGKLVHLTLFVDVQTLIYAEALTSWLISAKGEETKVIESNQIWNLISLLVQKIHNIVKWVYKVKRLLNDSIAKHNERLFQKWFLKKKHSLDFTNAFASMQELRQPILWYLLFSDSCNFIPDICHKLSKDREIS